MQPLQRVSDIVRVAKIQIRRIENGPDHFQVVLIVLLLRFAQMKQAGNVWNDVDTGQTPNHLIVDVADGKAMCRYH